MFADERTIARFWAKVDVHGPDECWPWLACKNKKGYGKFGVNGKLMLAHRFSFQLAGVMLESGQLVCHRCDNPPCCNPKHLWPGTHKQNLADASAKGRLRRVFRGTQEEAQARARLMRERRLALLATLSMEERRARWPKKYGPQHHCRHGHAYDETNTYYRRDGRRVCRACASASARRRSQAGPKVQRGAEAAFPDLCLAARWNGRQPA